jgi:sugar phosphate isomerase/epimerase
MPHLDMDLLTIHLWLDPRFVTPRAIDYKIGFLDRLIREAQPTGTTICLENLSETADHLDPVFQALPQLNLTLDIGHAQLLAEENTSLGFVARHAERIRHVHVHDNHGGNSPEHDLHLPLGQGIIDFKGIFQGLLATGYDRGISLELRPWEIEKCIHYIKEFLLPP